MPDLLHGFPESGENLGAHFEAKHVPLGSRIGNVPRQSSRTLTGDELFDLADRLVTGGIQPFGFGFRQSHPSKLANSREADLPCAKLQRGVGQCFERLGDAKLFLSLARAVAEQPLDVLRETAVTKASMRVAAEGTEQPATFFEVEPSSLPCELDELFVRVKPPMWVDRVVSDACRITNPTRKRRRC